MANKPLKSIKFPGLSDTYTVPEVDSTLTGSGKAADAKAVGDQLGDLKSAIALYEASVIAVRNIAPVPTAGYYVNSASAGSSISIVAGASYGYVKIPVRGGAKYAVNLTPSANFSWWAKDGGTNVISISKVSWTNGVTTAPSDATMMYLSGSGWNTDPGLVVIEQDLSITGKTTADYPRGVVKAVNIPLLIENDAIRESAEKTEIYVKKIVSPTQQNLIVQADITDNYYVKASDGTTASNNSFSVTDYIPVYAGEYYFIDGGASGSQVAFYKTDKTFIANSGIVLNKKHYFQVPQDGAYFRWCSTKSNKSAWMCNLVTPDSGYVIDTDIGLLNGLIEAYSIGLKTVSVRAGAYDVIAEYKAKYGNTYFSNYVTNYNGLANGYYDRGLWLDNIKIVFNPGAKVTCKYTDDPQNDNVRGYFSPFAIGVNVEIIGLVLDSENCRYGLHPDFNGDTADRTFLIMRNCDLKHFKSSLSQAIGAGLGVHSDWLFENCIFRSDDGKIVVRIHNNSNSAAQSVITFNNCYVDGTGWIQLNSYSTSTAQTRAVLTGCSWETPSVVGKETEESADNITMLAWGNELRSE